MYVNLISGLKKKLHLLAYFVCGRTGGTCTCLNMNMEFRGKFEEVDYLLILCGSWESNLGP